jgi:hypothetical protein
MERIPSLIANNHSASQEIQRNLWNPKVHYPFQKTDNQIKDTKDNPVP